MGGARCSVKNTLMNASIALIRGVNNVGARPVKMEVLRELCASLGCREVRTWLQSGNVVFRCAKKDAAKIRTRIEEAVEEQFGFRARVTVRTAAELKSVVEGNPFPEYAVRAPDRFLVYFLYDDPGEERRALVRAMKVAPQEIALAGREIYVWYPAGVAESTLRWGAIDKALGVQGTGRNWNTVTKLLAMAEGLG